jgi:hypothetical protein
VIHLRALTMGSTKLWLPSRRSVDNQRGGLSMVLLGHDLSGRFNGWNFLYLVEGSLSIGILTDCARNFSFGGAIPRANEVSNQRSSEAGDAIQYQKYGNKK